MAETLAETRHRPGETELDLGRGVAKNRVKVVAYDLALSGWLHAHPQYHVDGEHQHGLAPIELRVLLGELAPGAPSSVVPPAAGFKLVANRPMVLFVTRSLDQMWKLRADADRHAVAQVWLPSDAPRYAGRHGIFFTTIAAVTAERPAVVGLPALPPHERDACAISATPVWRALSPPTDAPG